MKKQKIIIAFTIALLFSILFSIVFKWLQTGNPFIQETILYGVIIFLNIIILGGAGYYVLNRFSKKTIEEAKRMIIPSFLKFVLLAFLISLLVVSAGVYIFFIIKGIDTSNFISHLFLVELKSAVKQLTIWILISSVFFFYIIWRKAIEREQHLCEENLKYKYQNLKTQVNPHFLFNSLNTLSELVYVDAKKSETYIQNLSAIYRYILENEETDLIDLNKEIEFVKQYFSLHYERDKGKIELEIDISDTSGIKVIPVSLQILVENALKHNTMSKEKPLVITISNQDDYIIVSNSIQKRSILESSTKTGLSNLKDRTKIIIGKETEVSNANNCFTVKLPVLK